jgi:hypothetical protein
MQGPMNVKVIVGVEATWTGKCLHRLGSAGPMSNQSTRHGVVKFFVNTDTRASFLSQQKSVISKLFFNDASIY